MGKRTAIPKKTRFEVFKRDKFTCQYCGRAAPDVVLEIDHIHPVSKGGNNDILNLITSCFDCNRGKSNRELHQSEEMKKQQKRLAELSERKEQIEMMLEWKNELEKLDEDLVDKIQDLLKVTGNSFSAYGRKLCKSEIKKYGFEEVYESTKISIEQYFIPGDQQSIDKTFNYIGRICEVRKKQKENPSSKDIFYLCKIGKNRFRYFNDFAVKRFLNKYYEPVDFDDLKNIFCTADNWSDLMEQLDYYYGS